MKKVIQYRTTAAVKQLPVSVIKVNGKFRYRLLMMFFLLLLSVTTALGVIYSTYMNRQLFNELHLLEQQRDKLEIEWGQLSLEQSTWTSPNRIEYLVRESLGMIVPSPADIIMVKY